MPSDTSVRDRRSRALMLALMTCNSLLAAGPALADATSSNTLSLQLKFRDAEKNRNGHSQLGKFDVNGKPAPPGQGSLKTSHDAGMATLTLNAPQNVVSVSPDGSDSKTTAASMIVRLANITGSGGGAEPADPIDAMLSATLFWDLDDSLVDIPAWDKAQSQWFVHLFINGVEVVSDNLLVTSPDHNMNNKPLPLAKLTLPPNSLTTIEARISLVAAVSSTRPPTPPPPPPELPFEPRYPSVPEPSTWALLILGFGVAGAALRCGSRRILPA